LVELSGIGYALPVEAPEEVAALVLKYLKERLGETTIGTL